MTAATAPPPYPLAPSAIEKPAAVPHRAVRRRHVLGPLGRRLLAAFTVVALSSVLVLSLAALIGTDQGLAASQRADREQALSRATVAVAVAYAEAGGWDGADLSEAQSIADGVQATLIVRDAAGRMVWPGQGNGPGRGGSGQANGAGRHGVGPASIEGRADSARILELAGPANAIGPANSAPPPNTARSTNARPANSAGPANGPGPANSPGPANAPGPANSAGPANGPGPANSAGPATSARVGSSTAPDGVGMQKSVVVDGSAVGTVRLIFHTGTIAGRAVAWSWVTGAAAVALVMALVLSWYISQQLSKPLLQMAGTARRFAAGDRAVRSGVRAPGEIGEVGQAFDTMADEVVRAESVRRQLAADVAHELRNPLAGLQAGLEELRDGYVEPDRARLASLHDQALRLARVVNDLAELSAAESAALSLRPAEIEFGQVVAAAVDAQEPMLRAAGLDVQREIRPGVRVHADPDRLHQAIVNLLANAARYCADGDRVTVRVDTANGIAVAEVADTGPGIAAEDLPHVFERLWRGRGSHGVAGSGIGLAVVRELVNANHGSVGVTSTPGLGSRFTIRLPLRPGSDPRAGQTRAG